MDRASSQSRYTREIDFPTGFGANDANGPITLEIGNTPNSKLPAFDPFLFLTRNYKRTWQTGTGPGPILNSNLDFKTKSFSLKIDRPKKLWEKM